MPLPTDLLRDLSRTETSQREVRAAEAAERKKRRAEDRAANAGEARDKALAAEQAPEIWTWLAGDGAELADHLRRNRIHEVLLIATDNQRRGILTLTSSGRLHMSRYLGPFCGDVGDLDSPADLVRRTRPEVILELVDAIRTGRVWDNVRASLRALRRAPIILLDDV